jgi:peptidoglycan/xylan/chitin deacetylase (PgdA/CDA1 family)
MAYWLEPAPLVAALIFGSMHRYFIKTPWLVKRLFSSYVWDMPGDEKVVYLTFDDGPHPTITPWVLGELKTFGAQATFFCIGKNVVQYPEVFQQVQGAGHSVGNHTFNHLNGWKSGVKAYIDNTREATGYISSQLFRPPYGRIKKQQARGILKLLGAESKIIMWDVLSADFDGAISAEQCLQNVLKHTLPGSIIVFHDSEKAYPHLHYVLPKVLEHLSAKGYRFKSL